MKKMMKKQTIALPAIVLLGVAAFNIIGSNNEERRISQANRELMEDGIGRNLEQVDSLTLYAEVGAGECLDFLDSKYDSLVLTPESNIERYKIDSLDKCAAICSEKILLLEHRGFTYDSLNKKCLCHYDDATVPLPLSKKLDAPIYSESGTGDIVSADNVNSDQVCYKKDTTSVGDAITSYVHAGNNCKSTTITDVVSYTLLVDTPNAAHCANFCVRFKMFGMHIGFEQQGSQCDCLFTQGEAPLARYLAGRKVEELEVEKNNKPFERESKISFNERTTRKGGQPDKVVCYNKVGMEIPDESQQITTADDTYKVWINEIHYRNLDEDKPFIEIIGPAGESASGYQLVAYQGRDGKISKGSVSLEDKFFDEGKINGWGFITIDLASNGIRKGKLGGDGMALIHNGKCLQFISYTHSGSNRSFLAKEGGCVGKASTPMLVKESRETHVDSSLQLGSSSNTAGDNFDDFQWSGPEVNTRGAPNINQELSRGPGEL